MPSNSSLSVTWLGHGTFDLVSPAGRASSSIRGSSRIHPVRRIAGRFPRADLILATHGHFDHIGDLVPVAKGTGAKVIGIFELCTWLGKKGVQNTSPMNIGGSQRRWRSHDHDDARRPQQLVRGGRRPGLSRRAGGIRHPVRRRHHRLLRRRYPRSSATCGSSKRCTSRRLRSCRSATSSRWAGSGRARREAARRHAGRADALRNVPLLTGTPARLRELLPNIEVLELKPGDTAR